MNVIKYLFTHPRTYIYLVLSCILGAVFIFLTGKFLYIELPLIFFLLMMIMRIADDIHDYTFDAERNKKQDLSEKNLKILFIVFSSVAVALHILAFKLWGLISILVIAYIVLEERVEILQRFFMLLLSCYYLFALNGFIDFSSVKVIVWLVISLIFPILFALYKGYKRRQKK